MAPTTPLSSTVVNVTFDGISTLSVVKRTGTTGVQLRGQTTIPSGTIVMFNGSTAPSGWYLCNGGNGTPDMRNRFIYGWGSVGVGAYGGAAAYGTSQSGGHGHNIGITNTTITQSTMPSHTHYPTGNYAGYPDGGTDTGGTNNFGYQYLTNIKSTNRLATSSTGSDGTHNHSAYTSTDGDHTHTATVIPPYYRLAFIMKA